jgi:hypothetical protein
VRGALESASSEPSVKPHQGGLQHAAYTLGMQECKAFGGRVGCSWSVTRRRREARTGVKRTAAANGARQNRVTRARRCVLALTRNPGGGMWQLLVEGGQRWLNRQADRAVKQDGVGD